MADTTKTATQRASGGGETARALASPTPPIGRKRPCDDVVDALTRNPDWSGLAVIDAGGRVVGLIARSSFLSDLAKPYARELYGRKPVEELMTRRPLIVDADATIDDIGRRIASEAPDALTDGFIVTANGRYAGFVAPGAFFSRQVSLLEARSGALDRARLAAERANQAKSAFLANMSHEIRTPLNGVLANLELLRFSPTSPEQGELLSSAELAAQTLLHLIGDVLDFSKIEAGKLTIDAIDTEPARVLHDVVNLLSGQARAKGVTLRSFVSVDAPAAVRMDALRLRQILLNLIGNALKFTAEGVVDVAASVVAEDQDEGVATLRFEVSDTGVGFAPEQGASLFDAFSQADASTTRRFGGAGLGLSICAKLAALMGGVIGCDGRPGGGASFWVDLPAPVLRPSPPPPYDRLRGLDVLVIVPDGPICDRALRAIERAGGRATAVADAFGAVLAVERLATSGRRYDAALVALGVFAAGDPAVKALMRLLRDYLPGVALAPREDRPLRRRLLGLGVRCMLSPPLKDSALIHALHVASGRSGTATQVEAAARDAAAIKPDIIRLEGRFKDRADRLRVLVIEDAPMNQAVARRQLERLGLACDLAEDGRIGLEMAQSGRYGLILSDIQMPEMDGYAFIKAFRSWETGRGRRTPVVAMTANALQGDAEQCLAAGMDDYLAKPVAVERLASVIARWSEASAAADGSPPPASSAASVAPVAPVASADLCADVGETAALCGEGALSQAFAAAAAIQTPLAPPPMIELDLATMSQAIGEADPAILSELLGVLLDSFPDMMADLARAVAVGDRTALRRAAHGAKGASANAAAWGLRDALQWVESNAETAPVSDLVSRCRAAASAWEQVRMEALSYRAYAASLA